MRKVSELGERKVIQAIINCLDKMPEMPIPFGDDLSAVKIGKNALAVVKTDMLVGKTDVPPGMSLRQAARKAVVMNVSDFAAKGVKPLAALVSLGLPKNFDEENIRQIGLGLNEGAREYEAYIIGGDTGEASDLVISCSLFGLCEKQILVKRSTAKPGDIVAVTGEFGKTAAGLKILLEKLDVPEGIRRPLTEAVFWPKARLKEGITLAEAGFLSSSIDSSDGLAWSLHELSVASNVGFKIDFVPLASEALELARLFNLNPLDLGLYGGEEYELVVTVKRELWDKAKKAMESLGGKLIRIGEVVGEKKLIVKIDGETTPIEPKGWEHFKS
ncbi:thiamine-phosphate kinase [Candidatus Bathyarchaeota archaeon]|nr:thiamine-phosphate kinase [Candidatus Bathyarchaeota archaeon]